MRDVGLWLAIATGGGIGAMARHGINMLAMRVFGPGFPWGTMVVNILGSFAMGVLIAWLVVREPHGQAFRAFWAIGVLGAFTTFSTFSLDFVTLFERKAIAAAGGYLFGSVVFSIAALVAGLWLGRMAT